MKKRTKKKTAESRPETPAMKARRERIAAEAPALRLTSPYEAILHPLGDTATVADLIAYAHDSGCNTINPLENAVVGHLSELAILERAFCGDIDSRVAGSDEDNWFHFFQHMRARLEVAMVLDERVKAANPVGGRS